MEELNITQQELLKLTRRKLWRGEYKPTENFRGIYEHAAVCFEDGGLVAVTGKAGDRESELYAALFADAPSMLLEISKLRFAVNSALVWLDKFGENAPDELFGGEQDLRDVLRKALNSSTKYEEAE